MLQRTTFTSCTLLLLLATASCGTTEPEAGPFLEVSGFVTVNDTAPSTGRVQVSYLHPMLMSPRTTQSTGAGGRYHLSIDLSDGLDIDGCYGGLVAYVSDPSHPLPIQSEIQRVVPHPVPDVCEGPVEGPDFDLDVPPNLVPVDVSGTVTLGGTPTSAAVRLVVASRRVWGAAIVAETVTDAEGRYRLVTEVPDFYCDNLEFSTTPESASTHTVSGCYTTTQDIELAS